MSGMFDPDTFLDTVVDGANAEERTLIPAKVYSAFIEDLGTVTGERKDGDPWVQLVVKWNVDDEGVRAELNRDKVLLSQYMFIDLDERGGIAQGTNKNVQLGKLRRAVGKNTGQFSPRELIGCYAKIDVRHVVGQNGEPREEVRGVASA